MKAKILISTLLWVLMTCNVVAQKYSTVTLIEKRAYYLNGGARASLGGKSRVTIKVDLPKNTIKWYYSFSTTPGENGTKLLNLAVQVGATLSTGGLTALAGKSFEVPEGSASVDVIVLPPEYNQPFLNKEDSKWRYYSDISLANSKHAAQTVENKYGNSVYLGLRNPSTMNGINIIVEVVAVVEEKNENTEKAVLYGNLGWKAFERGELDKCIELSEKSQSLDSTLCFVKFNIALVHLIQGKDTALDEYVAAISSVKYDKRPKEILAAAIQDIGNQKRKTPTLVHLVDVENLLLSEYNRY